MPSNNPNDPPISGEVTVPLASFIRPLYRHYFSGRPERPNYRARRYDFAGTPTVMPLVRAFLDTCAAEHDSDYRYLFTLLGSELCNNAIRHSRSGQPGGSYILNIQRDRHGLRLTCRDRGQPTGPDQHLTPHPDGLSLNAKSGRGLAMVDAFASDWGDNGRAQFRSVWFYLSYDLAGSRWKADH
ncbi:ATP-binding protein [Nocardiopsis sp. NPDC007018]|uniref:ATP-binding protein n=1 Tax=Nocardiopsis sp. NPDC007018 TaxID=3155721 RepID=UPI0033DC30D4